MPYVTRPVTTKSPGVRAAMDAVIGGDTAALEAAGKCPTCRKAIGPFKDELSRREYRISGMCQECQDSVFG